MTFTEDALIASIPSHFHPPRPSVIALARDALGRENVRFEVGGYYQVWQMGSWGAPLKLRGLVEAANRKLKAQGKPQITANREWTV